MRGDSFQEGGDPQDPSRVGRPPPSFIQLKSIRVWGTMPAKGGFSTPIFKQKQRDFWKSWGRRTNACIHGMCVYAIIFSSRGTLKYIRHRVLISKGSSVTLSANYTFTYIATFVRGAITLVYGLKCAPRKKDINPADNSNSYPERPHCYWCKNPILM